MSELTDDEMRVFKRYGVPDLWSSATESATTYVWTEASVAASQSVLCPHLCLTYSVVGCLKHYTNYSLSYAVFIDLVVYKMLLRRKLLIYY